MHYVILRDDDTNAFTPVDCLERLYRPFLDRGLPVNLSVIPDVRTDATRPDGLPERFLFAKNGWSELTRPIGDDKALTNYLLSNEGFHLAQHGYDHSLFEFDSRNSEDICDRIEQGKRLFMDAGFPEPGTFVAPHDRFSPCSLNEVAKRFRVISTGWFDLERLPVLWWPKYVLEKIAGKPHWQIGQTLLLTHPGCLLSCDQPNQAIFQRVMEAVQRRTLTVLVTHWWEYFWEGKPNEPLIRVLHDTAAWLAQQPDINVISFEALAKGNVTLY